MAAVSDDFLDRAMADTVENKRFLLGGEGGREADFGPEFCQGQGAATDAYMLFFLGLVE